MYIYTEDDDRYFAAQVAARDQYELGYKRGHEQGLKDAVRHGSWKHIKKHLWHKDKNGEIDMWYVDHGFHNGPGCEICGLSFCEHCEPDWAEDECRIGYYVCSECEQQTKIGDSKYCPNCGAKMDLKGNEDEKED